MDATLNFEFEGHFQGQRSVIIVIFGFPINLDDIQYIYPMKLC